MKASLEAGEPSVRWAYSHPSSSQFPSQWQSMSTDRVTPAERPSGLARTRASGTNELLTLSSRGATIKGSATKPPSAATTTRSNTTTTGPTDNNPTAPTNGPPNSATPTPPTRNPDNTNPTSCRVNRTSALVRSAVCRQCQAEHQSSQIPPRLITPPVCQDLPKERFADLLEKHEKQQQ